MKKITLTSVIAMCAIAPAMATPTNTSSTFPNDELMQADYTYTNQATYPNTGVYDGDVTAQAQYDWTLINVQPGYYLRAGETTSTSRCLSKSYCPGATGIHYDSENNQGIFACSTVGDGSYTKSNGGATSENDCYKDCAVENFSHAVAVSGKDYYGTGVDTCAATACILGYHVDNGACVVNTINITWNGATAAAISANNAGSTTYGGNINTPQSYDSSAVPVGKHFVGWKFVKSETFDLSILSSFTSLGGTTAGWINVDGSASTVGEENLPGGKITTVTPSEYGLTENNTWGATFAYGKIIGESRTSDQGGEMYSTSTSVSQNANGTNCWCRVTGFDDGNGVKSVSNAQWVLTNSESFSSGGAYSSCGYGCSIFSAMKSQSTFRSALYSTSNN